MTSEMISAEEAMKILDVEPVQLNKLVCEGVLRAFQKEGQLFRRADVNELLGTINDQRSQEGKDVRRLLNRAIKPQAQTGDEPILAPI